MKETIKKVWDYIVSLARPILMTSNIIVFVTFISTGFVMYMMNKRDIGMILFFAAFLYIIFNKMESMNKRINMLEAK